jgi:hypothetical protein
MQMLIDGHSDTEHVSGRPLECTTTNNLKLPCNIGRSLYIGAANSDNCWRAKGMTQAPYINFQVYTIFVYVYNGGYNAGTYNYLCGMWDGSSGFGIFAQHSVVSGSWGAYDGVIGALSGLETLPAGAQFLVMTSDGTNKRIYRNGILKNTTAGSLGNWNRSTFAVGSLGYGHGYNMSTNLGVLYGGFCQEVWSAQEIAYLAQNPWSLFCNSNQPVFTEEYATSIYPQKLITPNNGELETIQETDIIDASQLGTGASTNTYLAGDGTYKSLGTLEGSVGTILNKYNYGGF